MPQKAWTFALDGQSHSVTLEYSLMSANEKFWVDNELISDEDRWTFRSEYDFSIGLHKCQVILSIMGFAPTTSLTIDGQSVEILPSQILLRPSQQNASNTLLRPHDKPVAIAPDELLRPSQKDQSATEEFSWQRGTVLEADSFEGSVSNEIRRQRDEE